jgi:hypothetical protein
MGQLFRYSATSLQQIVVNIQYIQYDTGWSLCLMSFWDAVRRWLVVCYNDYLHKSENFSIA